MIIKAVQREVKEFLRRANLPHVFASLERSNVLPFLPKFRGKSIASERNAVRKAVCENKHLTAVSKNQREFHVGLADGTDWQKRSGKKALRKTFMDTGISEPFDLCNKLVFVFWEKPFASFITGKSFSTRPSDSLLVSNIF